MGAGRTAADLRTEIVGHTALCLLALLGVGLYTFTYSLVYYGSGARAVAVLELWMVFTHLTCAMTSCAVQAFAASVLDLAGGLPHVADAQCAAFLGVALAVTCLGSACLQGGVECSIYYPAAFFPPLAAAGSIAWVWVLYVAALGCQSARGGGGMTLGIGSRGGLTVAAVMGCVQPLVVTALLQTCAAPVGANGTAPSAAQASAGARWADALSGVDAGAATANAALVFAAMGLACVGGVLTEAQAVVGGAVEAVALLIMCTDPVVVYSGDPLSRAPFRVVMAGAALLPLLGLLRRAWRARAAAASVPAAYEAVPVTLTRPRPGPGAGLGARRRAHEL